MDVSRLQWLTREGKKALDRLMQRIEVGMTPSVAFEIAFGELDSAYEVACRMEGIEEVPRPLDPVSVEAAARFSLDCLFGAIKGKLSEEAARRAFWANFRRTTRPSLTPTAKPQTPDSGQTPAS